MKENTVIKFDLSHVLTPTELRNFKKEAKKAKAKSLKEHFMALNFGKTQVAS